MTIAVLGTGAWGRNIIASLERLDEAYVVCNQTGRFDGRPCFSAWSTMLARRPEGLIIAADPRIHWDVMKRASNLRIPVMVEKPVALSLRVVRQMDSLKMPIVVDYVHLFDPRYMELKQQLRSPIIRIASVGANSGPKRPYSSLYDYGPHDLAMAMDLLPQRFRFVDATRKRTATGLLHRMHFRSGDADVHILCGNGSTERIRRLGVWTADGSSYVYEDPGGSTEPLDNVLRHFLQVLDGAVPNPGFVLTDRIHDALDEVERYYATSRGDTWTWDQSERTDAKAS